MRPVNDKRVTQIFVETVPAPRKSAADAEAVVPSPPELNAKRWGETSSNGRLVKKSAAPSSVEPGGKTLRGFPRVLALPKISESGDSAGSDLVIRQEPPWKTFEKCYECDLAGTVAVCVPRSGRRSVWAIRRYPSKDANRILKILRSTHHKNVIAVSECFHPSEAFYTLSNFHPLTLDHIVACKAFPNQQQLAAIMSQKYVKDDGAVGIDNLKRWAACPAALEFLSATTSAVSFEELKRVRIQPLWFWKLLISSQQRLLIEIRWSTDDLIGLAWFALISARTFYSYTPPSEDVEKGTNAATISSKDRLLK
ncbi:uncharacterized protein AFUA_1G16060 [Aspergillus fumigatus Af293]|uniref:Protein kinase domain-containing protein n=1 Tax=Aspergillus fumigatus (strain ATCC MYA-4609 / CBS 101355 / FGSC A1100 / Af293) TaxID=330879 RepID=Q4WRJ8_ASPFU|nr:conserved hypothetical protein [Aspergillus fumigatus Af293]EAL90934.1 conserved hypothetical protein [Aspergillus fumigatus Af293]